MKRIVIISIVGAAATAIIAGTCASAFADSTSTPTSTPASTATPSAGRSLAAIQAAAKVRTTARIGKLDTAITKITAAAHITTADRTTILGVLNADVAGMNSVEATIAADTTVASAAADYKTIFTTYRVYAVALPQARIAAAADRMTGATIPRLTATETRLASALTGRDAGKSTPALQADLADMQAKIAAATSALDGASASALAVTPSDYNANHSVLTSARGSVKSAHADLVAAVADAKAIRAAIR